MIRATIILLILIIHTSSRANTAKQIFFPSLDGLKISADHYPNKNQQAPLILLFHQAGWSRGEYLEIAPKLVKMGFNVVAVDLRSGGMVNKVLNHTYQEAVKAERKTYFLDAYKDMAAALAYAKNKLSPSKIIIWGSSYSSSLAIKLAADFHEIVDGVLVFSPGEYFKNRRGRQLDNYIIKYAMQLNMPIFFTSAKKEGPRWKKLFEAVPDTRKSSFLPDNTKGNHGSRALWSKWDDHQSYWRAVRKFLAQFK